MVRSVVVFCSSSDKISPLYFSEMTLLAEELVKNNFKIIYGGARLGLMGRLADAALKLGGEVVGVIPEYLNKPGIVHESLSELIIVNDLLDRKKKMLSLADAVIAAPGGMGTIDEITEVISLKQLDEHKKPILFHNFVDYWRPLLEYFEELHARGMISQELSDLYTYHESAQAVAQELLATGRGLNEAPRV
ncbi:MAG: TIGR00730 family Rossman fold protein [Bdellovibrionales bacterium]|nr:TIGR00730 family Rossman fold protein [Bdellovibrionales bacterium]